MAPTMGDEGDAMGRRSRPGELRRRRRSGAHQALQRAGLRARVTLTFGLGALVLSATMAGVTYLVSRQFILHQREQAVVGQARGNATLLQSTLKSTPASQVPQLLTSLDVGTAGSRSVLWRDGTCYFDAGQLAQACSRALPPALFAMVTSGTPAEQHLEAAGAVELVVGVPIPNVGAAYFEAFDLGEEARTLQILAVALGGTALFTTIAGAVIGRWASGRLLRPLVGVTQAAETIAGGKLDTRMEASTDRDLAPLAASFNRMADALGERIDREARFSSDVSHELRSPLTTLAASLEVLERQSAGISPRGRQALDLLAAELRRFQHMVDDLLEISRFDTGSAELLLDDVEVGELVRQAAAAGSARGVPTQIDPEVADLHLEVDKRRLDRVLANLVANAERYAGGATLLAAEPGGRSSPGADPAAVRLVVTDRGPGVALDERQRIFERFYRGRAAGQRRATDGTGLGLSLVAEHVRQHGGRVWVEDAPGGGARFVVELPAHRGAVQ